MASRSFGVKGVDAICLATQGGLTLVALGVFGVDASGIGIDPETVRFCLAIRAGWVTAGPMPCMTCKPMRSASFMKYFSPLSLALDAMSFWYVAASLSSSLAFQVNHFSSTSAAATFVAFTVKAFLRVLYHSW